MADYKSTVPHLKLNRTGSERILNKLSPRNKGQKKRPDTPKRPETSRKSKLSLDTPPIPENEVLELPESNSDWIYVVPTSNLDVRNLSDAEVLKLPMADSHWIFTNNRLLEHRSRQVLVRELVGEFDVRELPEHEVRKLPKNHLRLILIDPELVGHPVREIAARMLFEDPPKTPSQVRDAILKQLKAPISAEQRISAEEPISVEKPGPDQTPTSKSLRKLLRQVGVTDKVELSNWDEIVRTAEKDVLDYESPTEELVPGSKLPELLVRAALDAGYGDAACRLIGRFHPSARSSALVLLMSRLASGLTFVTSENTVREALKDTCSYLAKTGDTGKLLWLLRLCPEQFRPPALSAHALLWMHDICTGLLLEYATRGWDAQLATTISESDPGNLTKLAELAKSFSEHRDLNPRYYKDIALGISHSVGKAFKKGTVHGDAYLAELGNENKECPKPAPLRFELTPAQLDERLYQETGISVTKRPMFKEPPQQWDGVLTYLRDYALMYPKDMTLIPFAVRAAKAACATLYGAVYGDIASDILKAWVYRLGDMGCGPELDHLRRELSDISIEDAPVLKPADESTATPRNEDQGSTEGETPRLRRQKSNRVSDAGSNPTPSLHASDPNSS